MSLAQAASDDVGVGAPPVAVEGDRPLRVDPKTALGAIDLVTVVVAAVISVLVVDPLGNGARVGTSDAEFVLLVMSTLPVWLAIFAGQRLYNIRFIGRRIDEVRRIVNATFLGSMGVALAAFFVDLELPRSRIIVLFVATTLLVTAEREVARRTFAAMRARGRMVRNVVIAGANPEGRELAAMLRTDAWLGYHVLGFVDDTVTDPEPVPGVPLLGTVADAGEILQARRGASVIVAASAIESATTNRLARDLLDRGVHVELSSTLRDIASQRLVVRPLGRFPVVYVEPVQRDGWRRTAKRVFDVALASLTLLAASPVLLAAMVAIRLDSRGPVLFRQVRVGRNGRPFQVIKLRTMVVDAEERRAELLEANEADGPLFKMTDDPRVTRVGKVLRTTSIDELPQLWNVIRGEMSLVGPRPALPHETEAWDPLLTQRLRVTPGITGMWQVNGRSESSFEDYTRLDLYYVDNWSLLIDLAILAKTVPVVLLRQGAK
ncbi:sugar transferase [Iamia majanohamensis]|uniref:Sugar transferase n=1 Tax=Iamia majanohamensis TaxID=467976 RepID=A0AAE9YHF2_9ACTN|nr:sugar transferase [Iamia majanohamensis]WCO68552.1 sugar transferase [Iamia majanohamensis]